MEEITYERVRELFRYDWESGELYWRTKKSSQCKLDEPAGCVHDANGYRSIGVCGKEYLAHRLIWLYHHGYFPETGLDHRDRVSINNRISNLREASKMCNGRNCGNRKNNVSGVKGVSWSKSRKKWGANITVNYKTIGLGRFLNFPDAVKARYQKECELNWSGCDSSSPAFKYLKENNLLDCHAYREKAHV